MDKTIYEKQMDDWIYRKNRRIAGWIEKMYGSKEKWMDGWMDKTNRWIQKWKIGWIEKNGWLDG